MLTWSNPLPFYFLESQLLYFLELLWRMVRILMMALRSHMSCLMHVTLHWIYYLPPPPLLIWNQGVCFHFEVILLERGNIVLCLLILNLWINPFWQLSANSPQFCQFMHQKHKNSLVNLRAPGRWGHHIVEVRHGGTKSEHPLHFAHWEQSWKMISNDESHSICAYPPPGQNPSQCVAIWQSA